MQWAYSTSAGYNLEGQKIDIVGWKCLIEIVKTEMGDGVIHNRVYGKSFEYHLLFSV